MICNKRGKKAQAGGEVVWGIMAVILIVIALVLGVLYLGASKAPTQLDEINCVSSQQGKMVLASRTSTDCMPCPSSPSCGVYFFQSACQDINPCGIDCKWDENGNDGGGACIGSGEKLSDAPSAPGVGTAPGVPTAMPAGSSPGSGQYQMPQIEDISSKYNIPNSGVRSETKYIVMHHTGGNNGAESIANDWATRTQNKASAHYVVEKSGRIVLLLAENKISWNSGSNEYNNKGVSIEIVNMGSGKDPYPEAQVTAVRNLVAYLIQKYRIANCGIVGHGYMTKTDRNFDEPTGFPKDFLKSVPGLQDYTILYRAEKCIPKDYIAPAASVSTSTSNQNSADNSASLASLASAQYLVSKLESMSLSAPNGQGCAAFVEINIGRVYKNIESIGIKADAWDVLAFTMKDNRNQIVCQYPNCAASMLMPGDLVFFRTTSTYKGWALGIGRSGYCVSGTANSDATFCTYNGRAGSIENFPITTHVGIYGGGDVLYDNFQTGTAKNSLSGRVQQEDGIRAIIRPAYNLLTKQ